MKWKQQTVYRFELILRERFFLLRMMFRHSFEFPNNLDCKWSLTTEYTLHTYIYCNKKNLFVSPSRKTDTKWDIIISFQVYGLMQRISTEFHGMKFLFYLFCDSFASASESKHINNKTRCIFD